MAVAGIVPHGVVTPALVLAGVHHAALVDVHLASVSLKPGVGTIASVVVDQVFTNSLILTGSVGTFININITVFS